MSLLDMIESSAGPGALQMIGARVGMSPDQVQSVVANIAPDLAPKLAQHVDNGGLDNDPAASAPPAPGTDEATDHGNGILGSIFGSKDASQSVASNASARTRSRQCCRSLRRSLRPRSLRIVLRRRVAAGSPG